MNFYAASRRLGFLATFKESIHRLLLPGLLESPEQCSHQGADEVRAKEIWHCICVDDIPLVCTKSQNLGNGTCQRFPLSRNEELQ